VIKRYINGIQVIHAKKHPSQECMCEEEISVDLPIELRDL
jgi:hypothetical protein